MDDMRVGMVKHMLRVAGKRRGRVDVKHSGFSNVSC